MKNSLQRIKANLDFSFKEKLKRILGYGAFSCVAIALFLQGSYRIGFDVQRIVGDPSCLPEAIYLIDYRVKRAPVVGDYVVAIMPETGESVGAKKGTKIIKKVIGVPGDKIKVSGLDFWVNGEHAGRLWLAKSIPGKKPGDFDNEHQLGENEFFLVGTEKESFDSRYWGALDGSQIIGYSHPLI